MTDENSRVDSMAEDKDIETLHKRIDKLTEKFDKCNGEVVAKLNNIFTSVEVIKKTCETRGKTCAEHVTELDTMMRGNGKEGVLVRLGNLEQKSVGKEKFAYLTIGALFAGCFSLIVALIIHFFGS